MDPGASSLSNHADGHALRAGPSEVAAARVIRAAFPS